MKSLRLIVLLFLMVVSLQATSLRDSIEDTLNNNPSVIASYINRDAYLKYVEQERGDYLPTLDLDAFAEKSKTHNQPDEEPPTRGWSDKDGWNVTLKFAYVLYDGGLTPAQVGEYQHRYNANKFKSIYDVEGTIFDTITTYLDLVEAQELLALAQDNIQVHEKYLDVAKEKEEISGEVLETYQVNSKYHSVLDRYLEQERDQYSAKSLYKKLSGKKLNGEICRPVIDDSYIPKSAKEAVEIGLRRSFKVNEQIETIKEQREKIAEERAGFLPTIKFEIQGQWDDDLELPENGREDIYRGRVYLNWNLFNGGKTIAATEKEKLFLKEEQKKLDDITAEVVDEINVAYYAYFNAKKRVDNLIKYVDDNYNILMVYKKQLADGTRTFIDILNAESELYRSDIDKINQDRDLMEAYYDLLNKMSMLSDVILRQPKQVCPKYVFTARKRDFVDANSDTSVSDDLKELFLDENPIETIQGIDVDNRLDKIYNQGVEKSVDSQLETKPVLKNEQNTDVTTGDATVLEPTTTKVQKNIEAPQNVPLQSTTNASKKYVLNITTLNSTEEVQKFIAKHGLEDKASHYKFSTNGEKIKVIYGGFETFQEAKDALFLIPKEIQNTVYIDNMQKHIDLKEKYKEFNS